MKIGGLSIIADLLLGVVAASLTAASCSSGNIKKGSREDVGRIQVYLVTDAATDVVPSIRVDIMDGTSAIDAKTVTAKATTLPDGNSGGDGETIFAIQPGTYSITARALDQRGALSASLVWPELQRRT